MLLKVFKDDFKMFDIDPLCSCILTLNDKCRELEYYAIEWDWDTTLIKTDLDKIEAEESSDDDSPQKINDR